MVTVAQEVQGSEPPRSPPSPNPGHFLPSCRKLAACPPAWPLAFKHFPASPPAMFEATLALTVFPRQHCPARAPSHPGWPPPVFSPELSQMRLKVPGLYEDRGFPVLLRGHSHPPSLPRSNNEFDVVKSHHGNLASKHPRSIPELWGESQNVFLLP